MKKFILLFIMMIFPACGAETAPPPAPAPSYKKISAEAAYEMMRDNDGFILLDVRTEIEFFEKRIEGAALIPDYELAERAEAELPHKDALILIYCRTGRRSALAAYELIDLGYTNVYDFGGIVDWPYETAEGE